MYPTSTLYNAILEDRRHRKETKLEIGGVTYSQSQIVSAEIPPSGLFETFSIGNCVSRGIKVEIFPQGTIPRHAEIKAFVRLVLDDQYSEWIPQGVYFITGRRKNKKNGSLMVTAYDALLDADETWLNSEYDEESWPMSEDAAVNDIAHRLGVTVDARTTLKNLYLVDYPVDENGDLEMREVLSGIAVANAGNFTMSLAGELLLVPIAGLPDETNYLVDSFGNNILFGGDKIYV